MTAYWEVKREGDPTCPHESFEQSVFLSKPSTRQVRCRACGRTIQHTDEVDLKPVWPEKALYEPLMGEVIVRELAARANDDPPE